MATRKVTITLAEEQIDQIRKLVSSRRTRSVSGFVQHAVEVALQDVDGWAAMLEQALEQTGGPPTAKERAWASRILGSTKARKSRRRKVA